VSILYLRDCWRLRKARPAVFANLVLDLCRGELDDRATAEERAERAKNLADEICNRAKP
jgi:hypothetical protein